MKTRSRQAQPAAGVSLSGGWPLKLLVVVCGAVLMSLEIAGARIISPCFGYSIYAWGGLISVFMGALSLGYYLGGRLADRRPSLRLLSLIVVISGVMLFVLQQVSPAVCEGVWRLGLGTRLGTLLACVVLFLLPGVLLGMVSPFSVRLASQAVADVGKTAGKLYALATLGSIAGTLVTSFFLIDFIGIRSIVIALGAALIAAAAAALAAGRRAAASRLLDPPRMRPVFARPLPPEEPHDLGPWGMLRLKLLAVVCGAGLMGLEIVGARVISPYFGHSIYVWGSLISVFLGALALGYYVGGRAADRRPSLRLLGSIVAIAGLMLLALRHLSPAICSVIVGAGLGTRLGTLVACAVLFFAPSFLMGMISPFAVRLAAQAVSKMGKTAGSLYALSTLGSIIGTLLTSLVLIDLVGIDLVVLGLGLVLIAAALVLARLLPGRSGIAAPMGLAVLAVPGSLLLGPAEFIGVIDKKESLVYQADSPYQHIVVTREPTEDGRSRLNLKFDRYIESAIYEGEPVQAATIYTNMMHLPLIFNADIKTVLAIGGGGGTVPREYHDHYGCDVHIVEIDPKVLKVARVYFKLQLGDRMRATVEDGRMFLKSDRGKYDLILVDAFSGGGQIPFHLTTREFFAEVREHLQPDGVLAMNVISALTGRRGKMYRSILRTWQQAGFGQVYVFPRYENELLPAIPKNIILIATMSAERLRPEEIREAASWLVHDKVRVMDFTLHASHYLAGEEAKPFADVDVLTDDFAPVELMAQD